MRRKRSPVYLAVLALALFLCGCGGSRGDSSSGNAALSKAEWIGLLGDKFGYNECESTEDFYSDVQAGDPGYNEIQACAEWGILTETGKFEPKEDVTWQYAMETSVRAIGIEKLNKSDIDMEVTEDNLVEFYTSNIASIGSSDVGSAGFSGHLTGAEALLVLEYAYDYAADLSLIEKVEYTYLEGVHETTAQGIALTGDGMTAQVQDGASYSAGDIIYVQPSEESTAYAVKVESVNGDELTYELAGMEEVFEELQVTGTFEATVIGVDAAEGIEISMADTPEADFAFASHADETGKVVTGEYRPGEQKVEAAPTALNLRDINFSKKEDNVSLNVTISDIVVTTDVDFGVMKGLQKADVSVSFKDKVQAKYTSEHYSKTIPLGSVQVALGTTPLSVELGLVANIGFDGEVTVTYTSRVVGNVSYQKGRGMAKSVSNNDPAFDFEAQATVTVEPSVKVELCCIGYALVNVKVTSGVVAVATVEADLLGNDPTCIDIYLYVPLRWAVNEDGCLMTNISDKLRYSSTVWDSSSSPINKRFHWEDGASVEACTRGQEKVETEKIDENGEPYDEYNLFEFEEIVFGTIRVVSQKIYLASGETTPIGILSVSGGYNTRDLVYSSSDTSVCTVNRGRITAVSPGGTTVEIATSDGKIKLYVAVVVEGEYNDTSSFQPL